MTEPERTQDQLLADLELTASRLRDFDERLDDLKPATREPLVQRHARVASRCAELRQQVADHADIEAGTVRSIDDLGTAVDGLELDFEAVRHPDPASYRAAVDKQLRAWRSRSEWLRVQGALASMEFRDDLHDVESRLAHARSSALVELHEANIDAHQLVDDVRDDVEAVLQDLRHAVERAADALFHSAKR